MLQYPKKDRGGVNPAGYVTTHILKDPPKAIFTRKYEPVNIYEVQNMFRPDSEFADPSRINESIKFYQRGVNPMVSIDYGAGKGVSNPYKVEVVRPPINPIETQVPISAPRIHQNISVSTNPGSDYTSPITNNREHDKMSINNAIQSDIVSGLIRSNPSLDWQQKFDYLSRDSNQAKGITLKGQLNPTKSYSIDFTRELNQTLRSNAVNDINPYSITSNVGFNNIVIFDPKNNTSIDVSANVKQKNYIAINAAAGKPIYFNTNDGKEIKLKDYTYSIVQSNIGNPQIILNVNQPDIQLERHTPLFAAQSNINLPGYNEQQSRMRDDRSLKHTITNIGSYQDRIPIIKNLRDEGISQQLSFDKLKSQKLSSVKSSSNSMLNDRMKDIIISPF